MHIEYEAKFINITKEDVRTRLRACKAELLRPRYLQRRIVFNLPSDSAAAGSSWLRVRDEGIRTTISLKQITGDSIADQKELQIEISDFEAGAAILRVAGAKEKAYQENYRELWGLDGAEVTIDEWPFLPPFVEVEAQSEEEVKRTAGKLEFVYSEAVFGAVGKLYESYYGIPEADINNRIPRIVFDGENVFEKYLEH